MDGEAFRRLLATIADAWNEGDTATALACFTDDARYPEPPDTQHYEGRDALFAFFGGDDPPPMSMAWHTIVFDEELQMGAAEYTYSGTNTYHGVVVIRLRGGRRQLAGVPAAVGSRLGGVHRTESVLSAAPRVRSAMGYTATVTRPCEHACAPTW